MSCEKYYKIAKEVESELLKTHGTVKGLCQEAVRLLYEKGIVGIPVAIVIWHNQRDYSFHDIFITPELCVIDPTCEQYRYAPHVYRLEDIKKYYKVSAYKIYNLFIFSRRGPTDIELKLIDKIKDTFKRLGIYDVELLYSLKYKR